MADVGFQLTVLATGGLIWAGPRLAAGWPALPPRLARSLGATLGAQLFTLPTVLATFRLATPWAPLWNLLALPWLAVALAGALGFAGLAVVAGDRVRCLVPVVDLLAAPFGWPAKLPPRGVWPLALGGGTAVAVTALGLWLLRRPRRVAWASILGLGVALLAPSGQGPPELHLLDVGQGDAILLRDGARAVLVDGGGWRHGDIASRVTVPALAALEVRRLDAIVLTHPDDDHCRGLAQLAGLIRVEELWLAPGWPAGECLRRLSTRPGLRLLPWQGGERRAVGRWTLEALPTAGTALAGDNDRSLVLMATAGERRVLLTGDLEATGERALLGAAPGGALRAEVLKVAHHGSRTSSSEPWLRAVQPRLALVSAGRDNRFGHPAPEIVERLRRRGVRLLRTDRDGWIRLRFPVDGPLEIATPAAPPG
jgi:competence protein ComEC